MSTPQRLAPLDILAYEFEDVALRPLEGWDVDKAIGCQISTEFNFAVQGEHEFGARLRIRLHVDEPSETPANLPYELHTTIRGWFRTPIPLPGGVVPAPFALNAITILYGVIRGYVGNATGMFVNGPMIAPAFVFDDMVERAARTPGTGIAPVDVAGQPAAEVYAFIFALDDMPLAIGLVQNEVRREALLSESEKLRALVQAGLPGSDDVIQTMRDHLARIEETVETLTPTERTLFRSYIERLRSGVDRIAAVFSAARRASNSATEDEG